MEPQVNKNRWQRILAKVLSLGNMVIWSSNVVKVTQCTATNQCHPFCHHCHVTSNQTPSKKVRSEGWIKNLKLVHVCAVLPVSLGN